MEAPTLLNRSRAFNTNTFQIGTYCSLHKKISLSIVAVESETCLSKGRLSMQSTQQGTRTLELAQQLEKSESCVRNCFLSVLSAVVLHRQARKQSQRVISNEDDNLAVDICVGIF